LEGVPIWVTQPDARIGKTVFVGQGTDQSAFNARLGAMNDILKQISSYLGDDIHDRYYREFSTTDAIKAFNLSVVREYRGNDATYLMVECDTKQLTALRTDVENDKIAEDKTIASLIEQADKAYQENNDVRAIEYCLDAVLQIKTNLSSYDATPLIKRSVRYLDAIRFKLSNQDPDNGTVHVQVTRKRFILSPQVKNAPVIARFKTSNLKGLQSEDHLLFNSAADGMFQFEPFNSGMVKKGSVAFSIDVDDRLEKLKPILSEEEYASIVDAIQARTVSFSYDIISPYAGVEMVVNIKEYSIDGNILARHDALTKVVDFLSTKGIKVVLDASETQDGAELAQEVHSLYPNNRYLLYGTVGVADYPKIGKKTIVVVSGQMQLYDLLTQKVLVDTTEIKTVGENEEDAFSQVASVGTSFFSEYL